MSQQTYPVACACGKVHWTPAGYAGSKFACHCGKAVEVPTLSELRKSVCRTPSGTRDTAVSHTFDAELDIGSRLRRGTLPVESACVMCQEPTTNAVPVSVVCERQRESAIGWLWFVLLCPPLMPIGLIILVVRSHQGTGRDVAFHLPVRVCEECQSAVFTEDGANEALRATPLYARLMQQYPETVVTSAGTTQSPPAPGAMYRQQERRLIARSVGAVAGVFTFFGAWTAGWAAVELALTPAQNAGWEGWIRCGVFVIAAAVGVLAGVGLARITAGVHRHFWPDPAAE